MSVNYQKVMEMYKIVIIGLASAFTEGMKYQDNQLAEQLIREGNEVLIISDCNKYNDGKLIKTSEETIQLAENARLRRLKYNKVINELISSKIRSVDNLFGILEKEKPDIIFQHNLQTYELLTVAKYKRLHPEVYLYVDSHSDYNNSAKNVLSRFFLHKLIYKRWIRESLPYIDKIFNISYESGIFLKEMYEIPQDKIEFFPLGGLVIDGAERAKKRSVIRERLNLNDHDILLVHTGKMNASKKTDSLVSIFNNIERNDNLYLLLIGMIEDDISEYVNDVLSKNKRIKYIGWKNGDELLNYLYSCDLYLQPGSQSATMQNAICCGAAVALYPYESHKHLLGDNFFELRNQNDLVTLLNKISVDGSLVYNMKKKSENIAENILDYKNHTRRLYRDID